ncbi:hypothetical protein SAMN06295970_11284 [Noviherbaspirillum suwonense]|uniref:Uncharacterized protein n=1 Tax=Noviherbaspirillum suwonense TaxID=1224511 RepID=A0ABY1QFN3_9BURK|nr:hypothetical protein SAMN06295970_11284 [Noviherbaspirillum suwonense]
MALPVPVPTDCDIGRRRDSTGPSRGSNTNTRAETPTCLAPGAEGAALRGRAPGAAGKDPGRDTRAPDTSTMPAQPSTTSPAVHRARHAPSGPNASDECHGRGNGVYPHATAAAPRLAATVMALLRRSGQGDRCKQENEAGFFRANHHAPLDHRQFQEAENGINDDDVRRRPGNQSSSRMKPAERHKPGPADSRNTALRRRPAADYRRRSRQARSTRRLPPKGYALGSS